jgi:hypothetical protein
VKDGALQGMYSGMEREVAIETRKRERSGRERKGRKRGRRGMKKESADVLVESWHLTGKSKADRRQTNERKWEGGRH